MTGVEQQPRRAKRFRRFSTDPTSTVTLWLGPPRDAGHQVTWAVYDAETGGNRLGYLHRYTGSLDRVVGRVRYPGKRRTLWCTSHQAAGDNYWQQCVSAAEALRRLTRPDPLSNR